MLFGQPMSRKAKETDFSSSTLKNESARQRWELFHRAIAHAKQANDEAMDDNDGGGSDSGQGGPSLSIGR